MNGYYSGNGLKNIAALTEFQDAAFFFGKYKIITNLPNYQIFWNGRISTLVILGVITKEL
jgi:hypothetical protein